MRLLVPVLVRLLSAILAIALIAIGVVAVVEIVWAWLGAGWVILPDDTAELPLARMLGRNHSGARRQASPCRSSISTWCSTASRAMAWN
jgi:hypothetical protein